MREEVRRSALKKRRPHIDGGGKWTNEKYEKYENYKKINVQQLIILEGFSQNGLQIWIQLIFYILQHGANLIFDSFWKSMFFVYYMCSKSCFEKGFGDLLLIWSIQKLVQMCRNFWIYQISKRLLKHFSKTRFTCWKTSWKTRCESKVACNISVFCSNSRFWKFDWRFQKLGVSDPTPTRLALHFEFFKSQTCYVFKFFFEKKSQSALNHVLIL